MNTENIDFVKNLMNRSNALFETMKLDAYESTKNPDNVFLNVEDSFIIAEAISTLYAWFATSCELHSEGRSEQFRDMCDEKYWNALTSSKQKG
jgi:hypothetical protein